MYHTALKVILPVCFVFCLFNCSKNKTAPKMYLEGENPMQLDLGQAFTDPGALARNNDGSYNDVLTDLSAVDFSRAGDYQVKYISINPYGTSEILRDLSVIIGRKHWLGTYSVTGDCGFASGINTTHEIVEGILVNEIVINGFLLSGTGTLKGNLDGLNVNFPEQVVELGFGITATYSGNGSIMPDTSSITVNYNYTTFFSSGSCTAVYDK